MNYVEILPREESDANTYARMCTNWAFKTPDCTYYNSSDIKERFTKIKFDELPDYIQEYFSYLKKEPTKFVNQNFNAYRDQNMFIAWIWDHDGDMVCAIDGDGESHNAVSNSDCKKAHRWEWLK